MLSKILNIFASLSMVAFGIWHFFVPSIWKWYSYIPSNVSELTVAIRAINVFFSLCLVLIGIANIIFAFAANRFSLSIMLALSCILWLTRVIMQIAYPQGSSNQFLEFGMLCAFIIIFLCFAAALVLTLFIKYDQLNLLLSALFFKIIYAYYLFEYISGRSLSLRLFFQQIQTAFMFS